MQNIRTYLLLTLSIKTNNNDQMLFLRLMLFAFNHWNGRRKVEKIVPFHVKMRLLSSLSSHIGSCHIRQHNRNENQFDLKCHFNALSAKWFVRHAILCLLRWRVIVVCQCSRCSHVQSLSFWKSLINLLRFIRFNRRKSSINDRNFDSFDSNSIDIHLNFSCCAVQLKWTSI